MKHLRSFETLCEAQMGRLAAHHLYLAWVILFIGIPISILAGVFLSSAVLVFPLALLFGWL